MTRRAVPAGYAPLGHMRASISIIILALTLGLSAAGEGVPAPQRPARRVPAKAAPAKSPPAKAAAAKAVEPKASQSPTQAELRRAFEAPVAGGRTPRNANYTINVRLDAASRTLRGSEILTWRNISTRPATDLQFHLYYNAWRNTRSSWMRERMMAGSGSVPDIPEGDWGWLTVTSIKILPAASSPIDVTASQRFIAPDDGNSDDRTVLSVPLSDSVEPGETVNVQIEWTSRVPRTFARTGAIGDYFFVAHWFPKIGVLEDSGWNCHQFHNTTEFFADYGNYDVSMTVPRGWVLGATGLERERRDNDDGTTTHRYVQEDVHDFTWTTSPRYLERTASFEHPTLPPAKMRLLLQPEHSGQAERHFNATRAALRYYGEWYGAYPYGHITIVDPAWQSGAGGMEYPTLFTAGSRWLAPGSVAQPDGVTVHEAGHQFWYGIVGSNEFEHAWLDEGLNTFSTARTIEAANIQSHYAERFFGGFVPWVFRDIVLSRAVDGNRLPAYRLVAKADAQSTPTWRYWPGSASAITYNKTALWLHTLERHLGWPVLQRILSVYFDRWKYRHPKPADFFAVANEVAGRDLTSFFDQAHRGSNVFDYGVAELSSVAATARGFFEAGGGTSFVAKTDNQGQFTTNVVARRYGEAIFPVDIEVTFANGQKVRERWDGRDRWKLFTFERPSQAVTAVIDPDRVLLLDVNATNNSRTLQPRAREAATKWTMKWLVWLQDVMLTYAMLI